MKAKYRSGVVTVIIPTYNRKDVVLDAMESVFNQTYRPIELIVVDDGSTDDTRSVIKCWVEAKPVDNEFCVNYISQENSGAPSARNLGLIHSNGEYLQFLDSDCELLPDKIGTQVDLLESQPFMSHCYCITEFINGNGTRRFLLGAPPSKDFYSNAVMAGFTSIAPVWRREALYETGPWDEDLAAREDWVYKARVLLRFGPGIFIPKILCTAKLHSGERISKHATEEFAVSVQVAIRKVDKILSDYNVNSQLARNLLAGEMFGVFKGLLRLRKYRRSTEALREADALGSGRMSVRTKAIRLLYSILRPKLFRTLVATMGRL